MTTRLPILFAAFLVMASPALGQCVSGSCVDGTGRFQLSSGTSYEGEFRDGLQHGQGVLTAPNGDSYSGGWLGGLKDGFGTTRLASVGIVVVGHWRAGKEEGVHTYTPSRGPVEYALYEGGELVRVLTEAEAAALNQPTPAPTPQPAAGTATLTWPSGARYTGQVRDGAPHGEGTYEWPSGARYRGEFRDGKRHGEGDYTWPTGARYSGTWVEGKRAGLATFFEGRDPQSGQQTMSVGYWRTDRREGFHLVLNHAAGRRDRALFEGNRLVASAPATADEYATIMRALSRGDLAPSWPDDPGAELKAGFGFAYGSAVGAQVPVVTALAPRGPAERAGLRVGDQLVFLDGRSLAGLPMDQVAVAVASVRTGYRVPFAIRRNESSLPMSVFITPGPYDIAALRAAAGPSRPSLLDSE